MMDWNRKTFSVLDELTQGTASVVIEIARETASVVERWTRTEKLSVQWWYVYTMRIREAIDSLLLRKEGSYVLDMDGGEIGRWL